MPNYNERLATSTITFLRHAIVDFHSTWGTRPQVIIMSYVYYSHLKTSCRKFLGSDTKEDTVAEIVRFEGIPVIHTKKPGVLELF